MAFPKPIVYQDTDDLETIDSDISVLFDKFVKPIDNIRSQSKPSTNLSGNQNEFINLQISNDNVYESRCSAFYRTIGFPVVSENTFYNPGFNPLNPDSNKRSKIKISFQKNKTLSNIIKQRENLSISKDNIFKKQDLFSSLYSLSLRHVPKFLLFSSDDPFAIDQQKFTISDRSEELKKLANNNIFLKDSILSSIGKIESGQKIIKPFLVDPFVDSTVMPSSNLICVPFLPSKESTQIEKNIYLQRPVIELIIRQILSSSEDKLFLQQVSNLINSKKSSGIDTSNLSLSSLVDSLSALSEENKITDATKDLLKGITNYQVLMINQLTKTIKVLTKELSNSISLIEKAIFEINWFPIPSISGPITGNIGASLGQFGIKNAQNNSIDSKIIELKIKKLNAERHPSTIDGLGDFASPFQSNSVSENSSSFDLQIEELQRKKDRLSNDAFNAIANIEKIVGEISGIGLIDIICIYLALWSLDINTLIHFLDDDSFNRMTDNFPISLGISEVSKRKSSGSQLTITNVLFNFESRLKNILNFADKSFELSSTSKVLNGNI